MVEGDPWSDPGLQQAVDEAIVKGKAFGIGSSFPFRDDTRPCYRKTVSIHFKVLQSPYVLLPVCIVIAADGWEGPVDDVSGYSGELVPYGRAPPIFFEAPFNLKCRCGYAELK
ncbi:MAG: hypothetical protein BWY82_02479 [Verrucomicrobia bacterium ADurb.Bin474]|nr:MAG: hypothetical protein BWY82_02479 [Verrucomicrobia bacterium ADurb.Bin474]